MGSRAVYRVFDIRKGEAKRIAETPYGSVGTLYADEVIEAVYVRKKGEAIDTGWFSQNRVDLILVIQGKLKLEFERSSETRILKPGNLLVLDARAKCRAYRWPRTAQQPTIFFAVYPKGSNTRGTRSRAIGLTHATRRHR